MTLQVKYNKLENDCFNLLIVDPNPPHDLKYFSLFLRLENTNRGACYTALNAVGSKWHDSNAFFPYGKPLEIFPL